MKLRRVLIIIGIICILISGYLFFFRVSLKNEKVTFELGEEISLDKDFYLYGYKWAVELCSFDFSEVDKNHVGEYRLKIDNLFKKFEVKVFIEDTTAPEIVFKSDRYVAKLNEPVSCSDYISECKDYSESVSFRFLNTNEDSSIVSKEEQSLIFKECGVHPVVLMATDDSGNSSSYYMSMIVDTAPTLSGEGEFYVSLGTPIDIYEGICALDDCDGDLSDKITSNLSLDYIKYEGDYSFDYSVTDSNGLTETMKGTVHSYDPLLLQDMVNTRKLDPFSGNVYGVINPYDSGYILEEDVEKAIDGMYHSVIHIEYTTSKAIYNGSGFIVKVKDDEIIICTNKHVVTSQDEVTVNFFDGSKATGTVLARQTAPDIAFLSVKLSDLSEDLRKEIRTVHINRSYYDTISSKPRFEMGMYCIKSDGSQWLKRTGYIVRKSGVLAEYFKNYDYPVMEVSVKLTPGVSGSAIIDSHGNLLCMATYSWIHGNTSEYYGVSLEDILNYYESVFNEKLEYY